MARNVLAATALSTLCTLCTLASASSLRAPDAQPTSGDSVTVEAPTAALESTLWVADGRAPADAAIELTVAVRQTNTDALRRTLMRVSSPKHPEYGRHLSNAAVHAMVAPAAEHVAAVVAHLSTHGVHDWEPLTPNADLIRATTTIAKAEAVLGGARYFRLRHTHTGDELYRILQPYALPSPVAQAVDFVSPTVHLPGSRQPRPHPKGIDAAPGFGAHNVPKTLRKLYSVGEAVGKAAANRQAVTAFLGQRYSPLALKQYWGLYCGSLECGKGLPKLVGDATTGIPGDESMLDIETITGVAGNIESEFWGFTGRSPDNPGNEPFMKWLATLSNTTDELVPRIFSTSYGEDESSWSKPAATRLNVEFQKAGVRGISLLFASGDEGANCKGGRFAAEGPGSSPFVTAVGGTTPTSGFPEPGSEKAVGLSSGGFSSYWAQPEWQADAVNRYLASASGLPPKSRGFNISGRAYPDIAAQATSFCITPFGCGIAGTSCASPTAAGVFSLLNDLRLQSGKPPLGFLNPFIYEHAEAFNDITSGSSSGCGFLSRGWPAAIGWDAVTGVGSPNYAKLAEIVKALP